ncbi:MAG: hypothetical protein ACRD5M_01835 [Candidatus Acidiferrales bacterium]
MSKVFNWGRWVAGMFFAFQGLVVLLGYGSVVIALAYIGEVTHLFLALSALAVAGLALLACAWGLIRVHRWAYGIALFVSILESILTALVLTVERAKFSAISFAIGGVGFGPEWPEIFSLLFACFVFGWLMIPEVRQRYWLRLAAA